MCIRKRKEEKKKPHYKNWTTIATQMPIKPCSSASIQGKPTFIGCKGKIKIVKPVSRELGTQRNHPEEITGLFRSRGSGFEKHGEWKNTQEDYTSNLIQLPIQQTSQARGLDRHGLSTPAPPNPQRSVPMEHGKQEVQPGFTLQRTWGKLPEDMFQRNIFQKPDENHQRVESQKAFQALRRADNKDKGETIHNPGYRGAMEP
ncbi:hypothetical protein O181_015448 [Austropuccinia psidii MF-1]|uniref:Uncharacterized protein n=1 Tax=Austropuccinia psidii MF-1 TaxID=1389203 RepID=A0A9Q3GPZ9_9BASI|nr:hypothetical protein [Austropuccinia psidii MF-1]